MRGLVADALLGRRAHGAAARAEPDRRVTGPHLAVVAAGVVVAAALERRLVAGEAAAIVAAVVAAGAAVLVRVQWFAVLRIAVAVGVAVRTRRGPPEPPSPAMPGAPAPVSLDAADQVARARRPMPTCSPSPALRSTTVVAAGPAATRARRCWTAGAMRLADSLEQAPTRRAKASTAEARSTEWRVHARRAEQTRGQKVARETGGLGGPGRQTSNSPPGPALEPVIRARAGSRAARRP